MLPGSRTVRLSGAKLTRSSKIVPTWTRATYTTPCAPWSCPQPSGCGAAWLVSEFALTPAERALLEALHFLGVRYLLVGMGAALLEGAHGTTQDLDLWFGSMDGAKLAEAARRAGGFYTPGFGMQPPAIGGDGLDRVDLVVTASGLDSFDEEYARAREHVVDDVRVRVLPLDRVIRSKQAANRPKDSAQIPLLQAALAARRNGDRRS